MAVCGVSPSMNNYQTMHWRSDRSFSLDLLKWQNKKSLRTLSIVELKIAQLKCFMKKVSHIFIPFSNWYVCLKYCIFNANVNMQKKSYLGDNFIAIRPWNQELHILLLCNLIYVFRNELGENQGWGNNNSLLICSSRCFVKFKVL